MIYAAECFGYFVYSPALTYEELLAREEEVKAAVGGILADCDAAHIHFESSGDALHLQCALQEHSEAVFHDICDKLAPYMDNNIDGRLLMVRTSLQTLHAYSLHEGKWQEAVVNMPPPGHLEPVLPLLVPIKPLPDPKKRGQKT
jgi:hypothetical protein